MFNLYERIRQYFAPEPTPGPCKGNNICEFCAEKVQSIIDIIGLNCKIADGGIILLVYMITLFTALAVGLLCVTVTCITAAYRKWRQYKEEKALRKRNLQIKEEEEKEFKKVIAEWLLRKILRDTPCKANKQESKAESDSYTNKIEGNKENIPRSRTYTKLENTNDVGIINDEVEVLFSNPEACTNKSKRKKADVDVNDDVEKCQKKLKLSSQSESKHDDVNIDINDKIDVGAKRSRSNSRAEVAPENSIFGTNVNIDSRGKRSESLNARAEGQTDHRNVAINDNIVGRRKKSSKTSRAQSEDGYYRADIGASDMETENSKPLRKAASFESAIFRRSSLQLESDSSLTSEESVQGHGGLAKPKGLSKLPDMTFKNAVPETQEYVEDTDEEILQETFNRNEGVSRIPLLVKPRGRVPRINMRK